jgi:hypothetical protein
MVSPPCSVIGVRVQQFVGQRSGEADIFNCGVCCGVFGSDCAYSGH